jgi:RNA polymerase sigma-70 factor (ECF subfamily)
MDNGASSYRRYLSGEEAAFEQIVKDYFDPLTGFINSYVHDMAAAEDIAIDVFSDLIVHKHRYNFRVSLKTYLFMIGRSRALNYIKRRGRFQMVELDMTQKELPEAPSPETLHSASQRDHAVRKALTQLHSDMREAVQLVYFEEMSCADVAKVMRKTVKQVYNLLYRAKTALRTILAEEIEL